MYSYYVWIIIICAFALLLKVLCRKRLFLYTPITVFCFMSLFCAVMMIDLIIWGMAGNAPQIGGNFNNISDFVELGEVLLWFTFSGIIGGILADFVFPHWRLQNDNASLTNFYARIKYILNKFSFILILNAIFGIIRIVIIFRYIDWNSFGDYREVICFELFAKLSFLEALIFRISNHLYVLAGFYIALYGADIALSGKIRLRDFITKFIFFSIPTMAMGGRLYILNFLAYFLSGFFFLFNLGFKKKFPWKTFRTIFVFILMMLALICIVANVRSADDSIITGDDQDRLWGGLYYITDANVILSRCLQLNLGGKAPAFESTLGSAKTFLENRESWSDMVGYVNGLYSHLYLDFDIPAMYFAWGALCFLIEALSILALSSVSVFGLLICCVFAKIMEEMLLFPSISGNYYCFEWIFVIYLIYWFFNKKRHSSGIGISS